MKLHAPTLHHVADLMEAANEGADHLRFSGYDAPTRETERPAQRLPEGWIGREETPHADKPDRHRSFYFRCGNVKVWVDGLPLREGRTALEGNALHPHERDALMALFDWLRTAKELPKETP